MEGLLCGLVAPNRFIVKASWQVGVMLLLESDIFSFKICLCAVAVLNGSLDSVFFLSTQSCSRVGSAAVLQGRYPVIIITPNVFEMQSKQT